jgi:hypothetical protein
LAAAIDISKERRDRLGRWKPNESDEYTRNAKQIIFGVQLEIAQRIKAANGKDVFGEKELVKDLVDYCNQKGLHPDEVAAMEQRLEEEMDLLGGLSTPPGWNRAEELMEAGAAVAVKSGDEEEAEEAGVPALSAGVFVVSQTKAGKDLTLHCVGRCWRVPGVHYCRFVEIDRTEMETVHSEQRVFNRVCSDCYPKGLREETQGNASSASSSASSGSSSDEDVSGAR